MATCSVLAKEGGLRTEVPLAEALVAARDGTAAWIDLESPTPEDLAAVGTTLRLHELTVEDLTGEEVPPKLEDFEDHSFLLFKAHPEKTVNGGFDALGIGCVLSKGLLLTVHPAPVGAIRATLADARRGPALLRQGPAFILSQILDRIVDSYAEALDTLEDSVEDLEETLSLRFDRNALRRLFTGRKSLIHLRRRVSRQREIAQTLSDRPHPLIPVKMRVYFRNLYDHLIRIDERLVSNRDLLQGILETYLAMESRRTNDVIKTLSILAAVMLPLTFVTGLYGTNFAHLPGKDSPWGFWGFIGVLVTMAASTAWYYRRRGWY
ncbi:MAG: magnesium transporter CorA family protein [Planctomycetes bacterium]|nr:magnesium transporter CorA family protein [Planctomycetota bacterium]